MATSSSLAVAGISLSGRLAQRVSRQVHGLPAQRLHAVTEKPTPASWIRRQKTRDIQVHLNPLKLPDVPTHDLSLAKLR